MRNRFGTTLVPLVILLGASCSTTEVAKEEPPDTYQLPSKDKHRDVHELVKQGNFREIVYAHAWDKTAINQLDADGRTPLDLALLANDPVLYVKMRKMGAVTTSLHFEAHEQHLKQFNWIAENRPNSINRPDKTRQYPLHRAARLQEPRFTRVLLKHGATTEVVDGEDRTPLHLAAIAGNVAVVAALLDHGANPNAVDGKNQTPLDYALKLGNNNTARNCQALLKRSAGRTTE